MSQQSDLEFKNEIKPGESSSLCVNCDDNQICKFQPVGHEVIFCEEYQLEAPNPESRFFLRDVEPNIADLKVNELIPG